AESRERSRRRRIGNANAMLLVVRVADAGLDLDGIRQLEACLRERCLRLDVDIRVTEIVQELRRLRRRLRGHDRERALRRIRFVGLVEEVTADLPEQASRIVRGESQLVTLRL